MFVPLVQYHGGGADATLEPLSEHLDSYGAHLAQNFASGVQACYRGPRLYDTDETEKPSSSIERIFINVTAPFLIPTSFTYAARMAAISI